MDSSKPPEVKAAEKGPKMDPALPEDPTAKRNKGIMEKMKAANKINSDEYKETEAYKNASPKGRKDIDLKVERARGVTGQYDNQ